MQASVIILIALAVRLYNLTYHSLWFDEAISVYWARQSIPRILEVGFTLVEDRLPPLYYLTLKGWANLAGFNETGVRLLSVYYGVLLVPVMAGIGAKLFNRRVALFSALLVALNPFLIWYAQEARMYAPAVLFSTLMVWAFLQVCWFREIKRPTNKHSSFKIRDTCTPGAARQGTCARRRNCSGFTILFVLFALAGLYSHLYTGFLLPALGLWLAISYPRAWRRWLWFAVAGVVIAAAFAPLALAIWRFSGEAAPGDPVSGLGQRSWGLLHAFTVWKAPLAPAFGMAITAAVVLFAIAAYLPLSNPTTGRTKFRNPRLLVTFLLITPFVIANLLLFRNHLAFFGERYFIVMLPWLLLLAAVGADNLGQRLYRLAGQAINRDQAGPWRASIIQDAPFALLLILTIMPLPGQWSVPAAKEAWRQSVAYLAEQAQPDHAILIHPDWVRYPFQFYFEGPGQTYAAFSDVSPATPLDGPLQGVVGDHPVIWLIESHLEGPDPERRVEQWFAARYPLVTELYPPGITLKGYAPGYRLASLPPAATPVDIRFGNGLELAGFQTDPIAEATDALFHPPSGWLHVTLYWRANRPVSDDAAPYLNLVGSEGIWGASLERTNDALDLLPPAQWPALKDGTAIIRHDLDVNLNPATPPGRYQLVVGLYGYGEQYPLAEVEIK